MVSVFTRAANGWSLSTMSDLLNLQHFLDTMVITSIALLLLLLAAQFLPKRHALSIFGINT
jgi:hypothetical protein